MTGDIDGAKRSLRYINGGGEVEAISLRAGVTCGKRYFPNTRRLSLVARHTHGALQMKAR